MALRAPLGYRDAVLYGTGATSRVYRAVEAKTGRTVALKRLHRQLVQSSEALARFRRELEALSALRHPSIVPIYDVVRWDGDPTLVMAFIEGRDLKEIIVDRGPLPVPEAIRILRALCDVLATAHGGGIVHRDIKPQNVRLDAEGRVFLLDFGSARLDAASHLSRTGTTVGTPDYMPPELFVGPVYDPRADIYGVGATLFEALTGRPPQAADSLAELAVLRASAPIVPVRSLRPDVPAGLAQVVDRALAIRPEDRFSTAALAVWALDHPEEERRFRERRSNNPLCLHCHTAVPPESASCPVCRREPFAFAPGDSHVVLDTVERPADLIEHLAEIAPERGTAAEIDVLARSAAALSFEKPRLISFISAPDAARLASELRGAHGHVESEKETTHAARTARWGWALAAAIATGILGGGVYGVLFAAFAVFFLDRLASLWRASQAILASSFLPRSDWLRLGVRATYATVAGVAGAILGLGRAFDEITFSGAYLLGVSSAAAVVLLSVFSGTRVRARRGPEPSVWHVLGAAIGALFSPRDGAVEAPPPTVRRGTALALMIVFVALVPLEMRSIAQLWHALTDRPMYAAVEAPRTPRSPPRGRSTPTRSAPSPAPAAPKEPAKIASHELAHAIDVTPGGSVLRVAAGALAPLWFFGSCAVLLRRRRQIRRDAESIRRELDPALIARLGRRRVPHRGAVGPGVNLLPKVAPGDAFLEVALVRATDLAPHLDRGHREELARAIANLSGDSREGADSGRLDRACILETDPAQQLRFRYLALEGELEAEAAMAWAKGALS